MQTNPHPPLEDQEATLCAGCGQEVSIYDDLMTVDGPEGPNDPVETHVDCWSGEPHDR